MSAHGGSSIARRAARAAFAAAAAVALYTAAAFGLLVYAGLPAAVSCLLAAAVGVGIAAIAARVVRRGEEQAKAVKIARAQLETARDAAAGPRAIAAARKPVAQPRSVSKTRPLPKSPPVPKASPSRAPIRPAPGSVAPAPAPAPATARPEAREARESREIQEALLPRDVPFVRGYHLEVDYQPCGTLGGDFYDFRQYDDGRLLLTLGDVSGKGPAGAIVMAMVQTLFRENASAATGPADLLDRVNDGFHGALGKGVFVTALAALLDPQRNRLSLAGAGHHPVLLLNPAERRTTRVGARGLALGLVSGAPFANSLVETSVDLAPGDSLLLFTDGATDSVEDLARDVGENRFLAAAAAAVLPGPHGALQRLRDDLWGGSERRDDTTLMLVSRVGGAVLERIARDRARGAEAAPKKEGV